MRRLKNDVFNVIKQFNIKSIFFKYWKKFTLITIIPFFILNILMYYSQTNVVHQQINNSFSRSSSLAFDTLSRQIAAADQSYTALQRETLEYFLSLTTENIYEIQRAVNALKQAAIENPQLHSVYLHRFSDPYILSTITGGNRDKIQFKEFLQYYNDTGTTNFILKTNSYDAEGKKDGDLLTLCYGVYQGSVCHGLIVLNYNFSTLNKLLSANEGEEFFLLDDNGIVFYSNNSEFIGSDLSEAYSYPAGNKDKDLYTGNGYKSAVFQLDSRDVKFVVVGHLDFYTGQTTHLHALLILAIFCAFLLPLLLSLYMSFSFYHSITEIIYGFSSINIQKDTKDYTDEISFIVHQITKLSNTNRNIENELASKIALLKNTQLSASQLQFNQHFLFNTLNLISVLAHEQLKGNNSISKAISLLSDLLRTSLDTKQYVTSVSAEILHAKKYIEIEQLKTENAVQVSWNIDVEAEKCKTVKLIFQPIIENAFLYGLAPLPSNHEKKLKITGKVQNDKLVFHFIDNGVGFNPKVLAEIKHTMMENTLIQASHIGLANVNSRIKLMFGDDYGVQIHSDENGSDIKITLPKIYD